MNSQITQNKKPFLPRPSPKPNITLARTSE